ncbi:pyridoxal-phosphate dependent enzyme [uncultured Winogradskyella sp.]|uniref:1-aminocyclopropane-1-carboxylate deaminase/D-cysteine desulfhydrase n=1 Tax=uncultured Winogradskyella sp. TaxID=395353 RepID=UPI002612E385|nr:pyridoxal-phosphate dependent enzyme [uncultured Winogradskyella sp.]
MYLKREDLIHPVVSGNKFRKLKYNILNAKSLSKTTLLTFGGAYSNHIAATAYAGNKSGFNTIGIIRGDELEDKVVSNPTLKFAKSMGMRLEFIDRGTYRMKYNADFIEKLKASYGDFYLIPEGGTNTLAVKGCEEIITNDDKKFNYICCCVGTGGTIAGIINSSKSHQKIIGFPALKGDFLRQDILKFATNDNWDLIRDYNFGGYGKIKPELISFINEFKAKYMIPLDPIYTGKMMYGLIDMIGKGYFPRESKLLAIHTGGLQGISGMNFVLKRKNLPLINI